MSKGPHGLVSPSSAEISHVIELLKEALAIVDNLGLLDVGARLNDLIESLTEVQEEWSAD